MSRRPTPDRLTAKQKAPAFQLYAGDWVLSTLGMPRELKGIYVDLLCWSWENGPLPDDPAWRQRVIGGSAKSSANWWNALRPRWKKTVRGWINPRLERQRQVQNAMLVRAKNGASTRWQASSKHMLNRWPSSSTSSSTSKKNKPAAPVPFRVYVAIATKQLAELQTDDLGVLAEGVKTACARQDLPYDSATVQKAIDAARSGGRRRA